MKKLSKISLLMMLLIVQSSFVKGQQNLVSNWSFELYDSCPNAADQISYCSGWSKFSSGVTSPDYYNSCAPETSFGVPNNIVSFQPDHRYCNAYAGVVTRGGSSNDREHIGIQLSQPMMVGEKYFISFYTVMGGEKPFAGNYYVMPSNNIGARLSTISYSNTNPCPINNWAHVNFTTVLNDTVNWTLVSGSIVADSAYNFLGIGNFFDDVNTDTMNYNCPNCFNEYSYYLIDDICVSTDSLLCNGGIDSMPCITSVNESHYDESIRIFPNPSSDFVNILFNKEQNAILTIINELGIKIFTTQLYNQNQIMLPISSFASGLYFLSIQNETNNPHFTKIIVKH